VNTRHPIRVIALVAALTLPLGLAACGSASDSREAGAVESSSASALASTDSELSTEPSSEVGATDDTSAIDSLPADDSMSAEADSGIPVSVNAPAPSKPANGTWPDANATEVGDNAVNPRFCVENKTGLIFDSAAVGAIGPGEMRCRLVAKQAQSNPQVNIDVTQKGNPRNLFCLSGEDYKIGRPTIHITPSWGSSNNNSCKWDPAISFPLGENATSDKLFLYPFQFQGFRGADETGAMPSKTLILRITDDEQWPDVNGAELKENRSNPRVCIDNQTEARFETNWKAVIKPNSMACFLTMQDFPNPVIAVKFYEAGVVNSGYCIEGQDYVIGRPDITLFATKYPTAGNPECGKKLKQFDLGENAVSKDYYSYPYHFTASRGADQSVGGPSKTLVLHFTK